MRRWRSAHPDLVRAQRRRYDRLHPQPPTEPAEIPAKFNGHALFDAARDIVGNRPYFDPHLMWEDTMGEVVLALLEQRDPFAAAHEARRTEYAWRTRTGPLYENVDVRDHDRKVIIIRRRADEVA